MPFSTLLHPLTHLPTPTFASRRLSTLLPVNTPTAWIFTTQVIFHHAHGQDGLGKNDRCESCSIFCIFPVAPVYKIQPVSTFRGLGHLRSSNRPPPPPSSVQKETPLVTSFCVVVLMPHRCCSLTPCDGKPQGLRHISVFRLPDRHDQVLVAASSDAFSTIISSRIHLQLLGAQNRDALQNFARPKYSNRLKNTFLHRSLLE